MRTLVHALLALSLAGLAACGGGRHHEVTLVRRPGLNFAYLAMNTKKAPFTDQRVREAVALAIDKDRIIQAAYAGFATRAETPVPPTVPFSAKDVGPRRRDPAKAKALLEAAGLKLPVHVTLSHGNNSRPYMPLPEEVAKQVAGDLEEAGFQVEIRKEEWSSYLKLVQNGQHQMALLGWSADYPDADDFLYVLLDKTNARVGSANNISFYESEKVHELLVKARRSTDAAERERLYHEAQVQIFQDAPMVPLVYTDRVFAHGAAFGPIDPGPILQPVLRLVAKPVDGRLVYVRGQDSPGLDPAAVTDGESSKVVEQVYDTLVRFKAGTGEVEPSLAVSWSRDEDGKTWTFRLREGVRFHDGTPLDAAAVVNAFERQRDPHHKHHFDVEEYAYWLDLFPLVEKVEAGAEPMTVVFRCSEPSPPFFLELLATFAMGIPSPKALDEYGADLMRHPVGTGPFRFVRWDQGAEIVLERNEDYWGGAPALKQVVFQVSENASVRTQMLLRGAADLIDNLDPLSIETLEGR